MKKTTLTAIVNYLSDNLSYADGDEKEFLTATIDELNTELNRGKEKADANRALYAEIWDAVRQVLADSDVAVTAQDLANETGYARGKIVYGLTNYWADQVEKTSGKVNTYSLKG